MESVRRSMEKNTVLYTERVEHEAEEVAKSIKIAEYEWKVCHMSANMCGAIWSGTCPREFPTNY